MKIFHFNFSGKIPSGNILALSPASNVLQLSPGAFATPGTHLMHAYDRILTFAPPGPFISILNPYIDIDPVLERILVETSVSASLKGGIIAAADGFPLLFILPPNCDPLLKKYLRFVSCSMSDTDIGILRQIFGSTLKEFRLPRYARKHFLLNPFTLENAFVHEETCRRISTALENEALPEIYAVVPHHAGDVLFAAAALRDLQKKKKTDVQGLVVNEQYASVARQFEIETIAVSTPVIGRDEVVDSEPANILKQYIQPLDQAIAPLYARMSFEYNRTNFSLEEHFRCAMETADSAGIAAATGKRIFLHLDAGWKTKILPEKLQHDLVSNLQNAGFELVILAEKRKFIAGIETTTFEGIDQLQNDVDRADLVIGMDSFPAHFSAYCRSKPTIVVFSSTKPDNSQPPVESGGVGLWGPMNCSPCHGNEYCPKTGGECSNFPSPEEITNTALVMLSRPLKVPGHWIRVPWMPRYTNAFTSPSLRRTFVLFHTVDMLLRAFTYHAWIFGPSFALDMTRQFARSLRRRITNHVRLHGTSRTGRS